MQQMSYCYDAVYFMKQTSQRHAARAKGKNGISYTSVLSNLY
jgi:hypothetical protein